MRRAGVAGHRIGLPGDRAGDLDHDVAAPVAVVDVPHVPREGTRRVRPGGDPVTTVAASRGRRRRAARWRDDRAATGLLLPETALKRLEPLLLAGRLAALRACLADLF